MRYKLVRTDKANDQLFDIVQFIAGDSHSITAALDYLSLLEKAINSLQRFPKKGVIPHYSILKHQGYRVLIVEQHLVFYKINEHKKEVCIYAILDGRREYAKLL
jgi:toxin ParE1/3/4